MIRRLKGKETAFNFLFALCGLFGIYLILAWASYSPSDNAWSVASTATSGPLNKTGVFGAWMIDLLYAFFGKVAFLLPFSLTGFSAYMLLTQGAANATLKGLLLRSLSFFMLMIGLAGLANTILSNTPNYLAGGFVGAMSQGLMSEHIGQFGGLFVAMLLTVTGFYFCSGQTLIPLLIHFYDWVNAKDATAEEKPLQVKSVAEVEPTEDDLQLGNENSPLAAKEPTDERVDTVISIDEQLTDLTIFKRPNISGLHQSSIEKASAEPSSEMKPTMVVETAEMHLFNPADIHTELPLPKINLPEIETEVLPAQTENKIGLNVELPKVRLNPIEPQAERVEQAVDFAENLANSTVQPQISVRLVNEDPELDMAEQVAFEPEMPHFMQSSTVIKVMAETEESEEQDEDFDVIREREFAEMERQRLAELEARAKAVGLEHTFNKITEGSSHFETTLPTNVQIRTEPTPSKFTTPLKATVGVEGNNPPDYPRGGYGETLIHPLLQGSKKLEKPTTPLPTLDLLEEHQPSGQQMTEGEIIATSRRIETALANYGVKATVEDVLVGPVVTRYEIKPAVGVKAAKITSLASDLAREMMSTIRITDVVPGKPYMGIEVPNPHREIVWLRDLIASDEFRYTQAKLPMILGKDLANKPVIMDMVDTPHLLVAGQTGGGKSVGINTMILSLLYKLTPEQVRLIMIDPKQVELSVYNDIPHLLTPVVTDMKKAANALRWAVDEMERRYTLLTHLNVRNITGYNNKIDEAEAMGMPIADPSWKEDDSMDKMPPVLGKLSYIVLVVDEFADLMMTAGKEVEEYIMRISQKARAIGIHLILATQRPSTDVITGVIKANIPSRIAFTVASPYDSRTILDSIGAENLLGRGDMLYSKAGNPELVRVHGAYMSDDDVVNVADNWKARGKPEYIESILESPADEEVGETGGSGDLDERFDEVVAFVQETGITSASGLQRHLRLGFNRAARILDQMEREGILSSPDKRGKREII
ncbi:DNA translocase FtsK [Haemophilus parahaemolyticus]|uniref:DNA translocase FtsK n=1 Tax=Haemophilus parahaemolyticus TaxID=735 RepID=A0A369ZDB8_HAEPH|nr:DNA translocase FtsK [Haemophilus parahaemolyticus]RDF03843.1 DNA translocase FtsK [Haemophilus parahaemolyticus]